MIKKFGLAFVLILFVFGLQSSNPMVNYFSISDATAQDAVTTATDDKYNPASIADDKKFSIFGGKQFSTDKIYECSECNIITPLFLAVSQLSYIIYKFWTPYLLIMMALFFGYWMLLFMWGKLKIGGEGITSFDFTKDIIKRVLKIGAVFVALSMSPQFLMRWTVEPMMDMASFVSNKFIDISRIATGNQASIKYTDNNYKLTGEVANKQAFPDGVREDLLSIVKNYSSLYRYGMALGENMVFATVLEGLKFESIILLTKAILKKVVPAILTFFGIPYTVSEKFLDILDTATSATTRVIGVIYLLVAGIGAMIFALYFLAALKIFTILAGFILNMGFAVILTPFALVSWAFEGTSVKFIGKFGLPGKVKNIFVGWTANLAMMSVVMTFCTYIIESLLMVEATIGGQIMTIKEYILSIGQLKNALLGGPGVVNIIWQNMDITLVFLCFGWAVSYLIKNVPVYTGWFFVGVENTDFSNSLWTTIKSAFGKIGNVTANTKHIAGDVIKGISNVIDGGGKSYATNENQSPIRNGIKLSIANVTSALKLYFKMPNNFNKIKRYSTNLVGESVFSQKKKFADSFRELKQNNPDLIDGNGDEILNAKDQSLINQYSYSKTTKDLEITYEGLSENGKTTFVNLLMDAYSDDDIKDLARLWIADKVEGDFDIKGQKKQEKFAGGKGLKNREQYLNKLTADEIVKNAKYYEQNFTDLKMQNYDARSNKLKHQKFLRVLTEFNTDKDDKFKMEKDLEKWRKDKSDAFYKNNMMGGIINDLVNTLTDSSATEKRMIDSEVELNNVEKNIVLHEQEFILKTLLGAIDQTNPSVTKDPNLKKLKKMMEDVNSNIDLLMEDFDLEYNANDERLKFYNALMKNPISRKCLSDNHLERDIQKVIGYLKNFENFSDDLDENNDGDELDDEDAIE